VVPFRLVAQPGVPIAEQVIFAAKKAMFSGRISPGDAFPSVRALSRAMKIHANTAQKVIGQLTAEGLLEVRPGIGTVVVQPPAARAGRARLMSRDVERLTVQAMQLGLSLDELQASLAECWSGLQKENGR
jgi:DNA-binding transcriptional regulator YhcF (GntR family)